MKLSVVIVNYNVKHYVEQCLQSLDRALNGIEAEVWVVDNHSQDGSVDYIRQRFPWVHLVASHHNNGFSRANNIAIRMSKGEYVLLLNPDTIVAENTLRNALEWMDAHPDAGSTGVRMINACGESALESRRGVPTPAVSFYKMSGLCSLFPNHPRFGHYYMSGLSWDEPAQIEIVSGAFCLLRRQALDKAGLLDEDFFMYGEDIDLSFRLLQSGFHNYYLPCPILHYKGESTQKSSFRYVHVFYEAMLIFFRKHNHGLSLLLTLPINAAIYAKATLALLKMLGRKVRKNLGFVSRQSDYSSYLFIGQRNMIEACRLLSQRAGLESLFLEGDVRSLPEGHLSAPAQSLLSGFSGRVNIVYDVHAYSYEKIFSLFMRNPSDKFSLATYDTHTQTLITNTEVIE